MAADQTTIAGLAEALNASFVTIAGYEATIAELTSKLEDANAALATENVNNNTLEIQMKAALEGVESV